MANDQLYGVALQRQSGPSVGLALQELSDDDYFETLERGLDFDRAMCRVTARRDGSGHQPEAFFALNPAAATAALSLGNA